MSRKFTRHENAPPKYQGLSYRVKAEHVNELQIALEEDDFRINQKADTSAVHGIVVDEVANSSTVTDAAAAAVTTEIAGRDLLEMGRQVIVGKNLYDHDAITAGQTLAPNGETIANALYDTSGYIPVEAGQPYTFSGSGGYSGPRSIVFYDSSRAFHTYIDNTSDQPTTTRTPAVDGFARATYRDVTVRRQVEKGTVATDYEEYQLLFPKVRISSDNVAPGAIGPGAIQPGAVSPESTSFFAPGKNLFNPDTVSHDVYVHETDGGEVSSAGYITTDYIPVAEGQPYTIAQARKIVFYDAEKVFVSGQNLSQDGTGVNVTVTPTVDGFLRVSLGTHHLNYSPSVRQIEAGNVATPYEPFSLTIPVLALTESQRRDAPLSMSVSGGDHIISTDLDGSVLTISTSKSGSRNGSFNFEGTTLDGTQVHTTTDDITPIRTFATVGANHGYTCIVMYTASGHGKTTADLGSTWTDGVLTYTLLAIDGDVLTLGGPYTVAEGVVTGDHTDPVATLTHAANATDTTSIPITSPVSIGNGLFPSVKSVDVRYEMDGTPITSDGTYRGDALRVTESYNILDYGDLIDWAQSHIGQSYAANTDSIDGVVRISNVFTFRGGGRCTVSSSLTALKPVSLLNTGFLQSVALSASGYTTYRTMPGVAAKSGYDFASPVDMTAYATTITYGPADYLDPEEPPSRYVDWLQNGSDKLVGFTMGYITDKTNSKDSDRDDLTQGWDMRATKKSYPVALGGVALEPGEHRNVEGFRNYVAPHPSGATLVNVVEDEAATYVHLDFHNSVTSEPIPLPDHIGKSVTVLQSDGLAVANDTVDASGLTVTVAGSAGRAVLKLE